GFKEISLQKNRKLEYKNDVADSAYEFREKVSIADIRFVDAFLVGESLLVILLGAVAFGMSEIFPSIEFYTVMSFVVILLYLIGPINVILSSVPSLVQLKVSWKRVNKFIDEIPATLELDTTKTHTQKVVENFQVRDLTFQYKSNNSDRIFGIGPIDMEVKKGEVLFIIGGNGSGKTTLAKLLVGLYEADHGSISIDGKVVDAENLGEYYSTVFSPTYLFKKLYNIDTENKKQEIDKYLNLLDLQEKVSIKNNEFSTLDLSGGQRKRLALLQCYLEDSPIYMFDEWAADQDPEYRKFFYRTLLPEMKKEGKIVIAITHDDHYFDVADKVLKMENGKLIEFSSVLI
ncbi:MAG: cyclic peptide export ABC transporter, partial [Cyclobacteriaceae bacterium]